MAVLSEEQTMIRDGAKSWVQEKSPVTVFRKLRDSGNPDGFDRAAWKEMAEMGWAGILIPEEFGGTGLGYLTLGLVLEETGRTLTASPLVSTALTATTALLLGGNDAQKKKYLPQIAEGKLIATLAVDEGPHHAPEKIALKAEKSGSGYKLNGKKNFVLDGGVADLIIVAARTSGKPGDKTGVTLFLVDGKANGLSREKLKTVDSRGVANLTFANVEVGADAILGSADQGDGLLETTLDRARVGLAAEMLGHAMQSFDVTLDYLKTRVQFGQVIGTFQALQHRAVDMLMNVEQSRSMAMLATMMAGESDNSERRRSISGAKVHIAKASRYVGEQAIQLHGGIAMTLEYKAGHYFRRLLAIQTMFGDLDHHMDLLSDAGGLAPADD